MPELNRRVVCCCLLASFFVLGCGAGGEAEAEPVVQEPTADSASSVASDEVILPGVNGVEVEPGLVFAGQPTEAELRELAQAGVRVLDLRRPTEDRGFDQPALAQDIGLHYQNVAVDAPALQDEAVHAAFREAIRTRGSEPLLVHCASGNRVAGLYWAMLVEEQGMPRADALARAEELGLTSPGVESGIGAYLDR